MNNPAFSRKPNAAFVAGMMFAAALPLNSAHADTLLTNGSFENPNIVSTNFYQLFNVGSTGITGWSVVGAGEIALVPDTFGLNASDGRQWIDLTGLYGYNKGLRSDAVTTIIGKTYTLSFDLGDYYAAGFQNASLSVGINGAIPQIFNNVYQSGLMDWERKSITWVADSTSASFTFLGVANGLLSNDAGIGLDNVTFEELAPVPVPAAAWLFGSGLMGLFGMARRAKA